MALRADRLGGGGGGGWPGESVPVGDDVGYAQMDGDVAGSRLYSLLLRGPARGNRAAALDELRQLVLTEGIPSESDGTSKLRIYVWLVLLGAAPLSTDGYLDLVRQGPSPAYDKIKLDTPRTLTTDPLFRRQVTENSLVRVLNGMALRLNEAHEAEVNGWKSPPTLSVAGDASVLTEDWEGAPNGDAGANTNTNVATTAGGAGGNNPARQPNPRIVFMGVDSTIRQNQPTRPTEAGTSSPNQAQPGSHRMTLQQWARETLRSPSPPPSTSSRRESTTSSTRGGRQSIGYVQGMNVLAAPFLYAAHSEVEAFQGLYTLLTHEVPAYILPSMEGVHRGLALVDEILATVDPELAAHLQGHGMGAKIWGFPSVLTLCACTPPLPEVLHLWDFLLAYGCHLNLLCLVAQVMMIRDQILGSARPNQVLRVLPPLKAKKIVAITMSVILPALSDELYESVVSHARC